MADLTMPTKPPKSPKYEFGERSERCLRNVHPHLVTLTRRALELCVVDFGVHCGERFPVDQKTLLQEGRTKMPDSRHIAMPVRAGGNGKAHAVDVHVFLPGRQDASYDWPLLEHVRTAFEAASKELQIPYNWGGEWKHNPDGPHFELPADKYPKDMPIGPMPLEAKLEAFNTPTSTKRKPRTRRGRRRG